MRTPIAILAGIALLAAWAGPQSCATADEAPDTRPASDVFGQPAHPAALKPFVAFSWSPTVGLGHVSPMLAYRGDPVRLAFATKNMADGCRVILGFSVPDGLIGHPLDGCVDAEGWLLRFPGIWPEQGIEAVSRRWQRVLSSFAFARGKCDLLVLDYEAGWPHWGLSKEQFAAIEQDPRFPAVRQRLGYDNPSERAFNWRAHPEDAAKWDSIVGGLFNDAVNRAVGTPLWKELPDAGLSNYESAMISKANAVPDLNWNLHYCEGQPVGTCQSPALYGWVGNIRITGFPGDWSSPMTALLLSADTVRASVRSCDIPVIPWVAYRSYAGDGPNLPTVPWAGTDYWQENVYHAMLSTAGNNVLFWNPHEMPQFRRPGAAPKGASPEDEQAMDETLTALARQAGGSPLATPLLTENVDFRASVLVSAARTRAGRTVARVTFAPGTNEADVKIGTAPFHVTRPPGEVGAWVVP